MKQTHIYLVENCYGDKNKVYIGKTIKPNNRKYNHKQKYGSHITFTIIDSINSDKHRDWVPLESYWIEQFRNWGFEMMNVNIGGGGLVHCSDEHKLKTSLANKNRVYSEETILKMSQAKLGRKLSEETKLKMSLARKDNKFRLGKKGQKYSEESKLKMKLSKLGKKKGPYKKTRS